MDPGGFFDTNKYVISATLIILVVLLFLICLYFAVYKRKCRKKGGEFMKLENQEEDDRSDVALLQIIDIEDEKECDIHVESDALPDSNDSPHDCNSFTSDDDVLSYKERKKLKKKKRHSLFPFSKSHLKSKNVDEKSSTMDLSESSSDTNNAETASCIGADSAYRYKSRSVESILSAYSHGVESFGDDLSTCRLNIYAKYYPDTWVLSVGCIQAECVLNTVELTSHWKVHITLLPFKKQRFQTTTMPTLNPVFNQFFDVKNIARQVLSQISVRYRLYGRISESGPKKMAGEINVPLSTILKDEFYEINEWRQLVVSNAQLKKTKRRKLLGTHD